MERQPALPSTSVPGLGFKNAATAVRTLRALHGRDPSYQKMVLSYFKNLARRVLRFTRKERKISNIKAAVTIFDKFLGDFNSRRVIKQNNPYLHLGTLRKVEELAGDNITEQQKAFIAAYSSVRGEYRRLRNVRAPGEDTTWDIVRNRELKTLKRKLAHEELFDDDGKPTEEHLEMLLWAYSPDRRGLWWYFYTPREEKEREMDRWRNSDEGDRKRRRSKRIKKNKKLSNMKEAIANVERSLLELKAQSLSKQDPHLSLDTVRKAEELAGDNITELQRSFIAAYSGVSGEYKRLRSVRAQAGDSTWDVVRNRELQTLKEKHAGAKLFSDDGRPTAEHIEMLLWAYSPKSNKRVAKRLQSLFETIQEREKERENKNGKCDKNGQSNTNDKRHKIDKNAKSRRKRQNSNNNDESGRLLRRSKRVRK
ncbi:uncharacterized protein LOC111361373 [Spodoptera litura]|uniref:Uncharacterized protein LOC111361373 n=1 Tax=Spodoptera litura TaxID=69820 RepID=A0A9J7J032_SPOLT|nr:uncharacterized protein LOC111361373 [Spodoptera litura]